MPLGKCNKCQECEHCLRSMNTIRKVLQLSGSVTVLRWMWEVYKKVSQFMQRCDHPGRTHLERGWGRCDSCLCFEDSFGRHDSQLMLGKCVSHLGEVELKKRC